MSDLSAEVEAQNEESDAINKAKLKYRYKVYFLLAIIVFLTLVDAAASWTSITLLGAATEGNTTLNLLADVIGFSGTMVVRALWGIAFAVVLSQLALRLERTPAARRARKIAYVGMWVLAIIFVFLTIYHLAGIAYYLSYS